MMALHNILFSVALSDICFLLPSFAPTSHRFTQILQVGDSLWLSLLLSICPVSDKFFKPPFHIMCKKMSVASF